MPSSANRRAWILVAAAALAVLPQAASAETIEELETMLQASAKPAAGLDLARRQADASAWLEALATLDRVIAADPKNKPARLLQASILCRIDDPDGAALNFSRLKKGDYKKAEWKAARAPCEAGQGATP